MHNSPFNEQQRRPSSEEVGQKAQEFAELARNNAILEERLCKLENYVKQLAHDLKTPLTPLLGASELLASGCNEKPWSDLALSIKMSAENLLRMVDELLDLDLCNCGKLALNTSNFDPVRAVNETTNKISESISPGRAVITVNLPPHLKYVRADETRLRQVLIILLLNAVRFSPAGGKVLVGVMPDDTIVKFIVQDSGIGIAKQDLQYVFEPYQMPGKPQPRMGGNGLALSKRLIELQGGRIGAESDPEQGNIFWFDLPVGESSAKMRAI